MARPLGHLTIVELGNAALPVNFNGPPKECSVASPFWGSIPELIEVIDVAEQEEDSYVVEHFPLDDVAQLDHLLHEARFRGVLTRRQGRQAVLP